MKRTFEFLAGAAALCGGYLIGIVDRGATEEIVTLAFVIAWNAAVAAVAPVRAWLWPLLVVAGFELLQLIRPLAPNEPNPTYPHSVLGFALLGLVLAVAGAAGMFVGLVFRRVADRVRAESMR